MSMCCEIIKCALLSLGMHSDRYNIDDVSMKEGFGSNRKQMGNHVAWSSLIILRYCCRKKDGGVARQCRSVCRAWSAFHNISPKCLWISVGFP
jgi:hypothetical protein